MTKPRKNPSKVVVHPAPRQGVYSGEEFEEIASSVLGGRGWQKAFVRGTGFAPSTVTRYLQGVYPVPQHVALIVELLAILKQHGIPFPQAFSAEEMPGND